MMLGISRSVPFRRFQGSVGRSTLHLNTIAVGLEAIVDGYDKPPRLNVKWSKPTQSRSVADQARTFVERASLVFIVEAMDSFLRDFVSEKYLGFSAQTQQIVTKAITRPGNIQYSLYERVSEIANELGHSDAASTAVVSLASRWRNAIVHDSESRIGKENSDESLISGKDFFSANYAAIDVSEMLGNFMSGKPPSLKEVTTIMAVCQNLLRALDEKAIKRAASTTEKIEQIAIDILRGHFKKRKIGPVWDRNPEIIKKRIAGILSSYGISNAMPMISAPIGPNFLSDLASHDLRKLEAKLSPPLGNPNGVSEAVRAKG